MDECRSGEETRGRSGRGMEGGGVGGGVRKKRSINNQRNKEGGR